MASIRKKSKTTKYSTVLIKGSTRDIPSKNFLIFFDDSVVAHGPTTIFWVLLGLVWLRFNLLDPAKNNILKD